MKRRQVHIFASDVATAIGCNKFKSIRNLVLNLWSKTFPDGYQSALDQSQHILDQEKTSPQVPTKTSPQISPQISRRGLHTDASTIDRLTNKGSNDLKCAIEEGLKTTRKINCVKELHQKQVELIKEVSKSELNLDDQEALTKSIIGVTNKAFGTHNEKSALEEYQALLNKKVKTPKKYYKLKFSETLLPEDNIIIEWYIGGKIDGLTSENELIETKNRVHCLFNCVRPYENVQIQCYLKILNLNKGYLVEKYKNSLNVMAVAKNPNYWESFIAERLESFIKYTSMIWSNEEAGIDFLSIEPELMETELINIISK